MTDKELALVEYLVGKHLTPKGNVSSVFTRQMDLATPEVQEAVWKRVGKQQQRPKPVKLAIREESEVASSPFICCTGQIITTGRCPVCGKGENGRNAKIENRRWVCLRLYDDDFEFIRSLAERTNSPTLFEALEKLIPTVNGLTPEDVPTPTRKAKRAGVSHALNNAIVTKMEELNADVLASSLTARATFVRVLLVAARKYVKEHNL
jgi:hypothetical protein